MSLLKTNEIQNYNGSSLTLTASTVSTSAQLNTGGNISVTGSLNVSDDSTTRTNLGLGTISTQDSDSITVTGGTATLGALTVSGSDSGALVRITQTGSGNALVVEDSANPDSSPFVITSSGQLLIGNTNAAANMAASSVLISNDGTASFAVNTSADDLVIDRETGGITIYGHTGAGSGRIAFGTATNNAIGSVVYQHTDNSMRFNVNGAERMLINSSGVVSVNTGYVTLNNNKVGGIQVTIADDAYAEITPPRVGAHFMAITEDGDNPFPIHGGYGFVFADFGSSAALAEISVGPNFETSTSGPPTGTTGNDAHATLFVGGTSGKIYLENRLGVTGVFQITFL